MGFYTYMHARADDGQVFYIGKGKGRRAWSTAGRSVWWRNVVQKHGLEVRLLAEWPDEASAFSHEQLLIDVFRERGAPLVNLTRGGEGATGRVPTEQHRARISLAMRGKKASAETREKLRAARRSRVISLKTRQRQSVALKGRVVSEATRARMSAAQKGKQTRLGQTNTLEHRARISAAAYRVAPKFLEQGQMLTAREWAVQLGVHRNTVDNRVRRGLLPSGAQKQ